VPRARQRRASVHNARNFSKGEKRGTQYQCKMDSVLRSNFAGGRIRKTETDFFEMLAGDPRRAGGCGRRHGGFFFSGRARKIKTPLNSN